MSPLGVFQHNAVNYFLAGSTSTLFYFIYFFPLWNAAVRALPLHMCVSAHGDLSQCVLARMPA